MTQARQRVYHRREADGRHSPFKPGFIHEAYTRFHSYSVGNQMLALFQCFGRGIQPGPLATFLKWRELGRHVKKGEKAITLCMPVTCKRTKTIKMDDGTEQEEQFAFTHFSLRPLCYHEKARNVPTH
jgi:hypothetical protein